MKILYKQAADSLLERMGVSNCYYKKLTFSADEPLMSKKSHHHRSFEVHLLLEGRQTYQVGSETPAVSAGEFLLIAPGTAHRVLDVKDNTRKYSLSFHMAADTLPFAKGALPPSLTERMRRIAEEAGQTKEFSRRLAEAGLAELIITLLRQAELKEAQRPVPTEENATLTLAKQYMSDNVESAPTVAEVAAYVGLCQRQLTRLFTRFEGCTPGAYLLSLRLRRIEQLLACPRLTLGQISEQMHFGSEYYFNAFFKQHAGLPPGEYRKMHTE